MKHAVTFTVCGLAWLIAGLADSAIASPKVGSHASRSLLGATGSRLSSTPAADTKSAESPRTASIRKSTVEPAAGAEVATVGTVAGTSNDFCANALVIAGTGSFNFNSSLNNQVPDGAPACLVEGQSQIERDEWFRWTAPAQACTGEFVVSTCGSLIDTKIAVYAGTSCANTSYVACSDDDCALQTHLPFVASPGQQFLIRIGVYPGSPGGAGVFTISCREPLPCEQPGANCQAPDSLDGLESTRGSFVSADDFTPTNSGSITGVCWWGAYVNDQGADCEGIAPDAFIVKYFSSINGAPGALLATFSQSNGTLTIQGPAQTGLFLSSDPPAAEYEFSATHAALPVSAGQCYWIEITNDVTGCTWFWETSIVRNQRAFQDGGSGRSPDGYDPEDATIADLAFCLSLALGDSDACLPGPPTNDACAAAVPITAAGQYFFEIAGASSDGPAHTACLASGQTQISKDAWYCFTAPCTEEVFIRTCEDSEVDTRIAVYNGCSCPVTDGSLLRCNDDLCGPDGLQSMTTFDAVQGQQYLVRLGTFPSSPGGAGFLDITCGPPDHPACPGTGSCCAQVQGAACGDNRCCESVCACDPFCCEVSWDMDCATDGFDDSGCGATALCNCSAECGEPDAGDCCTAHANPSCSDATCCQTVCQCDSFCCETEWDVSCATDGFNHNGCGAAELCESCAPDCPVGAVSFISPVSGLVDARRPHPANNASLREGISTIVVSAPAGAEPGCFDLFETTLIGSANFVANVAANGTTYTLTLNRPITPGAVTNICYTDNNGSSSVGQFTFHPANANADSIANSDDVLALVSALNGNPLPDGIFRSDTDRSGVRTPLDLLAMLDLLNGAAQYNVWLNTDKPTAAASCP